MTAESAVLVLNRHYQPIHVTSVRRGFSLLYQGVAKAIDEQYRLYAFEDWAELSAEKHERIALDSPTQADATYAFDLADPMLDGVLDDRLEDEIRNESV